VVCRKAGSGHELYRIYNKEKGSEMREEFHSLPPRQKWMKSISLEEVTTATPMPAGQSLFGRFHLYGFLGTGHFTVSAFDAHLLFYRNIPILGRKIKF